MRLGEYLFSREQSWHLFIRQRIQAVQNYPRNKHFLHPCLSDFPNIMHANVAAVHGGSGCVVVISDRSCAAGGNPPPPHAERQAERRHVSGNLFSTGRTKAGTGEQRYGGHGTRLQNLHHSSKLAEPCSGKR